MEPKTANDGTKNSKRWNQYEGEKERLPEGERTWKRRRKHTFLQSDDSRHPYRRPGSSIWMTRVNRYEVSIIYPSSIGPFSLK